MRRWGIAASSRARNGLQPVISAGVGRLAGGTQRTALVTRQSRSVTPSAGSAPAGDLGTVERAMIEQALKDARFNKSAAAKRLGLSRAQLYVRLKRHGLE